MPAPHLKNSHCSYCGAAYAVNQPWPRTCAGCGATSYINPLPVAVLLLPVDDGVLVVRGAIPPRQGQLALPGGFIDQSESWQAAAVRELHEEAGIIVNPTSDLLARTWPSKAFAICAGHCAPSRAAQLWTVQHGSAVALPRNNRYLPAIHRARLTRALAVDNITGVSQPGGVIAQGRVTDSSLSLGKG